MKQVMPRWPSRELPILGTNKLLGDHCQDDVEAENVIDVIVKAYEIGSTLAAGPKE